MENDLDKLIALTYLEAILHGDNDMVKLSMAMLSEEELLYQVSAISLHLLGTVISITTKEKASREDFDELFLKLRTFYTEEDAKNNE